MAITAARLQVEIGADSKEAEEAIKGVGNKMHGWMTSAVGGLSKIGSAALTGGVMAAGAGIVALGVGLVDATKEAMAAQTIQAQLGAVLKSTGGVSGMTAQAVNDLATGLSLITPFEDDAIVSGENMLLTFTNIGKDVFPGATDAMLNMSQALGTDLQTSAMQLGKALNDPIQGVTALRRVGVQLTDEQEATIKAMVESGDVMGAQKIILGELTKEFGGSAQAAGETFPGSLEIAKNALGNIKEMIGGALLPALTDLATMFKDYLASPEVQAGITAIATNLAAFAAQAVTYLPGLIEMIKGAFGWLMDNQGVIVAAVAVIGAAIVAFLATTVIPMLAAMVSAMAPVIVAMALIGGAAYLLYEAWTNNWGGIRDIVMNVWNNNLKPIFDQLMSWLQTNIPVALKFLSDLWQNTLLPAIKAVWGFLSTYIIPLFELLANVYFALLKKQLESYAILWSEVLAPALKIVWEWFNDKIVPVLQRVAEWVGDRVGPAFDGLGKILQDVTGWLNDLAGKINSLKLPDWLTPGSATPFELGLRGISQELSNLARVQLPVFQAQLNLNPGAVNAIAAPGGGGYSRSAGLGGMAGGYQGPTAREIGRAVAENMMLMGMAQ